MRVLLVRHGQTNWNVRAEQIKDSSGELVWHYNGRKVDDMYNSRLVPEMVELTPLGHKQAEDAAYRLRTLVTGPVLLITSEKERAIVTASYSEIEFGTRIQLSDARLDEHEPLPKRPETKNQVVARVKDFLDELVQDTHLGTPIIFSHAGALTYYLQRTVPDFPGAIGNCEIIDTDITLERTVVNNRYQ